MVSTRKLCAWMSFIVASSSLVAGAQQPQPQQPQLQQQPQPQQPQQPVRQSQPPDVVATVNGDPITQREVDVTIQKHLQQLQAENPQQIGPEVVQQIKPQAVNGLIESRLVEQYAIKEGPAVKEQEVKASVDQLKGQLSEQGSSFDQFLASQGQTKESFQTRIKGSIAWQKFQQQQLTDEKLDQFFQENQDRFGAESRDQVQQEVANAYVGEMWKQIVGQMKPEAEIRTADRQPGQQAPPVPLPR